MQNNSRLFYDAANYVPMSGDVMVWVAACLDTVTTVQQLGLTVSEDETEKQPQTKVFTKDDFSLVSRFDSKSADARIPALCVVTRLRRKSLFGMAVTADFAYVVPAHGGGWVYPGHTFG